MHPRKNQLAVVTGGTRGIGRGIVERLAQAGYDVVFTYSSSEAAAADICREAATAGQRVAGYRCDAASLDAVKQFARTVLTEHGTPYAIVNNVGITRDSLVMNMPPESWHDVLNANVTSAFYMTNQFLPAMMEKGDGCLLQMSSVSGLKGNRGQANYGATKAALIGFTRALATEIARFNLRANVVAPGFIATEMVGNMAGASRDAIARSIPLRRLGTVNDVAAMVEFLLSADASYVTGQTFVVDGGITI